MKKGYSVEAWFLGCRFYERTYRWKVMAVVSGWIHSKTKPWRCVVVGGEGLKKVFCGEKCGSFCS